MFHGGSLFHKYLRQLQTTEPCTVIVSAFEAELNKEENESQTTIRTQKIKIIDH